MHRVALGQYAATQSAKGRPAMGETANQEKAKELKNTRYALLKNPENLFDAEKAQLEFLMKANPRHRSL